MRSIFIALTLLMTSATGNAAEALKLRAGVPEGLPGYTMGTDGSLIIESALKKRVFQCIEKALNAQFSWEAYPTNRVVQMLIDGKLDIAFPMGFTIDRESKMKQSQPAWENPDYWLSMHPLDIKDKSLRIAARLGSPQQIDHVAEGYSKVTGTYTYKELVRILNQGLADAVIVPQSVYNDMKADWPKQTRVTMGRPRNSGFYLNVADPKGLLAPLNIAVDRCRAANN